MDEQTAPGPEVALQGQTKTLDGLKLNLGCGPVQPSGWVNVDGSHRAWLANRFGWLDRLLVAVNLLAPTEFGPGVEVHDLLKPLPFQDNVASCVYSGELWEHFELSDAARLTKECHRVLAPGGVLRVCVPDGVVFWRRYLDIYEEEAGKPEELRDASRLRDHVQLYFNDIATRRMWLQSLGHKHKWQFDEIQLLQLFRDAGFVDVRRMPFQDSRIPDVKNVERSDFLIVEGVKPLGAASPLACTPGGAQMTQSGATKEPGEAYHVLEPVTGEGGGQFQVRVRAESVNSNLLQ